LSRSLTRCQRSQFLAADLISPSNPDRNTNTTAAQHFVNCLELCSSCLYLSEEFLPGSLTRCQRAQFLAADLISPGNPTPCQLPNPNPNPTACASHCPSISKNRPLPPATYRAPAPSCSCARCIQSTRRSKHSAGYPPRHQPPPTSTACVSACAACPRASRDRPTPPDTYRAPSPSCSCARCTQGSK
jgi:hypothetical protein